ncbi:MAG: carbohydrate binding domain-containing protein [Caulobacteraceae bacterium]
MILNGGAETGTTSGWADPGDVTGAGVAFAAVTTDAYRHEGRYGFTLTKASTSDGGGVCCLALPVGQGRKYRVRLWVYAPSATAGGLYVRVGERDGPPSGGFVTSANRGSYTDLVSNGAVTSGWTFYDLIYTGVGGKSWVSLAVYSWTGAPTVLAFDDVQMAEVTALGSGGAVYREDGSTKLTDNTAVTALGTAAAITGQGPWATSKRYYQTSAPTTGMVSGDIWFDTTTVPNVIHIYDQSSTTWVKAGPTQASEITADHAGGASLDTVTQYLNSQGTMYDYRGLPINSPYGQAAYRSNQAPLSASSSSAIAIAAHTLNLANGSISLPSGTISGLSASTPYNVFRDLDSSAWLADATIASTHLTSTSQYVYVGQQATPSAGAVYPTPPSPPAGGRRRERGEPLCLPMSPSRRRSRTSRPPSRTSTPATASTARPPATASRCAPSNG